ncbi:MAG TPA: hypothetical protein VM345_02635 [Acidimicrobiales bacterium]|jgi:hypothetical protein|nr:hypothetical protein [Acidimicrobiales bacterium]
MADRIDILLASAVAQQERDMVLRARVASDLVVGAPPAPPYWYRRPQRGERVRQWAKAQPEAVTANSPR